MIEAMAKRIGLEPPSTWTPVARAMAGLRCFFNPWNGLDLRRTGRTTTMLLLVLVDLEAGKTVAISAFRYSYAKDLLRDVRRMGARAGVDTIRVSAVAWGRHSRQHQRKQPDAIHYHDHADPELDARTAEFDRERREALAKARGTLAQAREALAQAREALEAA